MITKWGLFEVAPGKPKSSSHQGAFVERGLVSRFATQRCAAILGCGHLCVVFLVIIAITLWHCNTVILQKQG